MFSCRCSEAIVLLLSHLARAADVGGGARNIPLACQESGPLVDDLTPGMSQWVMAITSDMVAIRTSRSSPGRFSLATG